MGNQERAYQADYPVRRVAATVFASKNAEDGEEREVEDYIPSVSYDRQSAMITAAVIIIIRQEMCSVLT